MRAASTESGVVENMQNVKVSYVFSKCKELEDKIEELDYSLSVLDDANVESAKTLLKRERNLLQTRLNQLLNAEVRISSNLL